MQEPNSQKQVNPNLQKLQYLLKDEEDDVSGKLSHLLKDDEAAKQDDNVENTAKNTENIIENPNISTEPSTNMGPASVSSTSGLSASLPTADVKGKQELAPGEKVPSSIESNKNVYDKEALGYFYVNKIKMDTFYPSRFVNRL